MTLLGILLGITALTGDRRASLGSKSLARELAADFRAIREQARATGQPVVLVFPSQAGSTPVFREILVLEGEDKPVTSRVLRPGKDNQEHAVFFGTWARQSGTEQTLTAGPGNKAVELAANLNAWLPADVRSEYCLVFTPGGALLSNGMAGMDDTFQFVCCAGAEFQAQGGFTLPPFLVNSGRFSLHRHSFSRFRSGNRHPRAGQ